METKMQEYDGMMFLPMDTDNEDEDALEFKFITFNEDFGKKIEGNTLGEKYHVAFFKCDDEGEYTFDETFEAIFMDPVEYAKTFIGMNLAGTFIKKREKTTEWFKNYLQSIIDTCKIQTA